MAEIIAFVVRYETKRSTGETRREYNERFGVFTPEPEIPPEFAHFFEWFWEISKLVDRNGQGYCRPISAQDYKAWQELTGEIVEPADYDILQAMDAAYVNEMNKEIQDDIERRKQSEGQPNGR